MGSNKGEAAERAERGEERRGGWLTNYVPAKDLITCLEAKAEIITLPSDSLEGTNAVTSQILIPQPYPRHRERTKSPRPTPHILFPPVNTSPLKFLLEGSSLTKWHSGTWHRHWLLGAHQATTQLKVFFCAKLKIQMMYTRGGWQKRCSMMKQTAAVISTVTPELNIQVWGKLQKKKKKESPGYHCSEWWAVQGFRDL